MSLNDITFATNLPSRLRRCHPGPKSVAETAKVERHYDPDRETMMAALRILLGLPRWSPRTEETHDA